MMSLHGISHDAWKRYTKEGSWYYEVLYPGFKYNLTDIAAAIGIEQLKKCDAFLASQGTNRRKLISDGFADLAGNPAANLPSECAACVASFRHPAGPRAA